MQNPQQYWNQKYQTKCVKPFFWLISKHVKLLEEVRQWIAPLHYTTFKLLIAKQIKWIIKVNKQ